jgi:hypothetical protein
VRQLGVDETSFLRANRHHHKIYVLPEHNGSRQRHRHFQIRNRCGPIDTLQIADIDLHPILRLGTHPLSRHHARGSVVSTSIVTSPSASDTPMTRSQHPFSDPHPKSSPHFNQKSPTCVGHRSDVTWP